MLLDPLMIVSLQSELTSHLEPFAPSLLISLGTTSLPHATPIHPGLPGGLVTDAWS